MVNISNSYYDKKYVFDVIYDISYSGLPDFYERIHERVTICENHSKFAYAKCATYLFKRHRHIKEIISIQLLNTEPNN